MKKHILIWLLMGFLLALNIRAEMQILTWGNSIPDTQLIGDNWLLFGKGSTPFCVTNWQCSSYESCNYTDTKYCLAVTDLSFCGINFTGNISSYDNTCSFCSEHPELEFCEVFNNMWYVAIAIILLGLFVMLLYLGKNWEFALFNQKQKETTEGSTIIKAFIILLLLWLIPVLLQFTIEIAEDNSASADIITLLNTIYTADFLGNIVITAYMVIYFLFNILMYLGVDIVGAIKRK